MLSYPNLNEVLCIFFVSDKSLDADFKDQLQKKFSFLLKVNNVICNNDSVLVFSGLIQLADKKIFQSFLRNIIDDFCGAKILKAIVIFSDNIFIGENNKCSVNEILEKFLFLYKNKLISFSSNFALYSARYINEKYENYLSLKRKVFDSVNYWRECLELYVQPICSLTQNSLYGYEVLSRLKDLETGELIYPREFFEVFYREPELSIIFQDKVLRKVIETFPENFAYSLHVNFTVNSIQESYPFLLFLKEKSKIKYPLSIEIVEYNEDVSSIFLIKEEIVKILNKLHKLDYKIFFDDMSEGLNNFNILLDFPYDGLKFSKELLNYLRVINKKETVPINDKKCFLLFSFFSTMKEFKEKYQSLFFVEGVENYDDLILVKNVIKANFYQGFYLSKPKPVSEIFQNK